MLIFHVKVYDSLRRYTISKDEESSFMQKQSMLSNNVWHQIECVKKEKKPLKLRNECKTFIDRQKNKIK